jgi:AAA domain
LTEKKIMRASEWPKRRVTYAYDGFLPRKTLSMVAGKRGDGKSLFAAWITAQITTGVGLEPDGTADTNRKPGTVWYNTMEDAPDTIVRARLQAAGADLDRVFLTDWHVEIPDSAGQIRDVIELKNPDLLILDSMQQHFRNVYHGFRENRRGMDLMFRLAKGSDIAVLFVHHFNKGKHPSVEGAIGGQGVIQNMCKAIFVMGQHRASLGTRVRYLACERINAARPPSLSFELRTKKVPGYSEEIPFLEYTGIADVSSMDVFDASKVEERKAGTLTSIETAREWLVEYFKDRSGAPQKIREVEATAREAGRYFSKETFDRARERAGIEPMSKSQLQAVLGEEFDWLPSDDLPPRAAWVRLGDTAAPQLPG